MDAVTRYRCGFYYEQLTIDQQMEYRQIASKVAQYKAQVMVTESEKSIHRIKLAIQYDNPEMFYWSVNESVVDHGMLRLQYLTDSMEEAMNLVEMLREKRRCIVNEIIAEELAEQEQEQGNVTREAVQGKEMSGDESEGMARETPQGDRMTGGENGDVAQENGCGEGVTSENILAGIYDYLADKVKYADDELQKPVCAPWIYSIVGPLIRERGVCLGLAQTLNYFCLALHIPAILVTGEARVAGWNGNHGWNLVKMGNKYFHVDVTSEICDGDENNSHKFYMKTDRDFEDRKWPKTIYPEAG